MPKQARLSGIKSLFAYTIEEAAEVCGVSTRTVRNWADSGLVVMADARPVLIRGDALKNFIKVQRRRRKVKTNVDTFYCFRCREERRAAEDVAVCTTVGTRATLSAFCETCETIVSKSVALRSIPALEKRLNLSIERREAL